MSVKGIAAIAIILAAAVITLWARGNESLPPCTAVSLITAEKPVGAYAALARGAPSSGTLAAYQAPAGQTLTILEISVDVDGGEDSTGTLWLGYNSSPPAPDATITPAAVWDGNGLRLFAAPAGKEPFKGQQLAVPANQYPVVAVAGGSGSWRVRVAGLAGADCAKPATNRTVLLTGPGAPAVTDSTLLGAGIASAPLGVTNPFTLAEEIKLDGIEAGASNKYAAGGSHRCNTWRSPRRRTSIART